MLTPKSSFHLLLYIWPPSIHFALPTSIPPGKHQSVVYIQEVLFCFVCSFITFLFRVSWVKSYLYCPLPWMPKWIYLIRYPKKTLFLEWNAFMSICYWSFLYDYSHSLSELETNTNNFRRIDFAELWWRVSREALTKWSDHKSCKCAIMPCNLFSWDQSSVFSSSGSFFFAQVISTYLSGLNLHIISRKIFTNCTSNPAK